jgi:uncharacterized protein
MKKNSNIENKAIEFVNVDNIPVAFCRPNENDSNNSIAIWLPYLGGDKETGVKELQKLASHGYFALSIDPWMHGDRKGIGNKGIRTLVFKDFKAYMWQILGITTLDVFRVIDWAIQSFKLDGNVVVGGLSMGGDIAISLAGIDKRVSKVSAIASSPDWNRPGMTDVMDSKKIIEQGKPTPYGKWLYDKLDPTTNSQNYSNLPFMHIELGALDTHINPNWTDDFRNTLCEIYPNAEHKIEIIINEGCNHLSLMQRKTIIDRAINFLIIDKKA